MTSLMEAALALHDAGCCVVPARPDGSKAPAAFWKQYQQDRPARDIAGSWLGNNAFDGFGIICGTVSRGLEMLEFEGRAVTRKLHVAYRDLLAAHDLGVLWQKIISGYTEITPGGGLHILYRVSGAVRGNTKLARNTAGQVLIETRGEGGFTIVAPSGGRTHPTGRSWQIAAGGPATIITISEEERDALHAIATLLDEQPPLAAYAPAAGSTAETGRPGDDFNIRATWQEILAPHGWICVRSFGAGRYGWRRPGKEGPGISATTRDDGGLYVFSTSTPFETEKPYSRFGAYALLEHNGDYSAAAARLRRDGYGTPGQHPDHDISGLITGQTAAGEPPGPDEPGDELTALAAIAARYVSVDWDQAWLAQPEDTDWLIKDFLERGTVNALFSRPGTGKSLIALELAVRIVRTGEPVVYVDDENRISDLVERLQAFGCTPGELALLHVYSFAGLPALDTITGGTHLLALAVTRMAALVVLDTTTRMVEGKENDSDTFLQLYRCSLVPLKARGITVLRLDHPGKDMERGQRGSSAKDGDVDTIWKLTTLIDDKEFQLERVKSRSGHGDPAFTLIRHIEPLQHDWTSGLSVRAPIEIQQVLNDLEMAKVPVDAGRDRCRAILKEFGIQHGNDLLGRAIKRRKELSRTGSGQLDSGDSPDLSAVPTNRWGQRDRSEAPGQDNHESCWFGPGLPCIRPDCKNPNHRAAP